MVSLFGQVWLWSLLSFVAGVLVTWLVQVRPAKQRIAELEANRHGGFAGPARPQPPVQPSQMSSPMRDEEFDNWHVGARANSDAVLAPPPAEQMWPQSPVQGSPQAYEAPRAYEPPRPAELPRPLEPQRLIEPPQPLEASAPDPRPTNDVTPFKPVGAFGRIAEPDPEPESDNYDELPPALTRIPENAEPNRVVEPVDVPEEEKPRSLFQRLTPEEEVQAEPVPLNPAQEPAVFRRADLDELPEVPEIPADRTRYLTPVGPEIAPPQEEPTAPPEVEEWHPREMWREEEEEEQPELVQPAEAEHELLDEFEEDFAADDTVPVEDEPSDDAAVAVEDDAEQTSVIPAGEVQRAIAAADARLDAERQPWPEHSLTGQFPVITDEIASSKGQLGVEPDDPDDRRDDPDELTADARTTEPSSLGSHDVEAPEAPEAHEAHEAESRGAEARTADSRVADSRTAESRAADTRAAESRGADFRAAQAGAAESRATEFGSAESRAGLPSVSEPSTAHDPAVEVHGTESRAAEPASAQPIAAPAAESRPVEPRFGEPATPAPRSSIPPPFAVESDPADLPAVEFFPTKADPAELTAESRAAESRAAESRAADFFAPQSPAAEPVAPPAKAPKPAERPRSLFEPIEDETDDDPEPAETVRQLPPSDDQPFVPTLAPELLARGANGLPQRPQRPAGGPPPMTSPPLLGPPQPAAQRPLPQKPMRPRPVGFSPSTGGRSEAPAPPAPRYQQPEGFNPRSPFGPGSVLPRSDGHAPAADFEVKATLTGRRYFRPGTTNFDDTRADVWFRTESDAQKAGFRPAQ